MSKSIANRNRKHRRQIKMLLKHGKCSKAIHKLDSGRTGSVHSKKLKSRRWKRLKI